MIPTPPTTTETAAARMKTTIRRDRDRARQADDGRHALDLVDGARAVPLAEDLLDRLDAGRKRVEVARLGEERLQLARRRVVPGDGDRDEDRLGNDLAAPERVDRLLELADDLEGRARACGSSSSAESSFAKSWP